MSRLAAPAPRLIQPHFILFSPEDLPLHLSRRDALLSFVIAYFIGLV